MVLANITSTNTGRTTAFPELYVRYNSYAVCGVLERGSCRLQVLYHGLLVPDVTDDIITLTNLITLT
jgi:hypothetical protein